MVATALVLLFSHVVGWHIDRDRETCSSNGLQACRIDPGIQESKTCVQHGTVRCVSILHVGSHEWVMGNMLEQQFQRQCMISCIIRSGSGDQFQDGGDMFSPTPSSDEEDAHSPTVAELKRAQAAHARAAKKKRGCQAHPRRWIC